LDLVEVVPAGTAVEATGQLLLQERPMARGSARAISAVAETAALALEEIAP
jgi:hypothetical protein